MVINKRGQAFLMAAIIIAGLVFGASKVANIAKADNNADAFYDLTNEVDFETRKVLDYGVIDPYSPINDPIFGAVFDEQDVKDFLSRYNEYISGEEVLFIWGDAAGTNYYALNYQTALISGLVSLNTNAYPGTPITLLISVTTGTSANVNIDQTAKLITVTIRGISYTFQLREGQKFYFVLIKDENGEKFVAKR